MKVLIKAFEIKVARYPENFEDWKLVRLEYLDQYNNPLRINSLWLPPKTSIKELEDLFNGWQKEHGDES